MGDDQGGDDEKPLHRVFTEAFHIARVPITNAQYALFVQPKGGRSEPLGGRPSTERP